jgi:general secretion pathway protein D
MMRRLPFCFLFAFFLSLAPRAWAEPVSFAFTSVPLMDFAQATYRNLLGRDFVISSDLVTSGKKITISVKGIEADQVPAFVENVLRSHGVKSTQRGGVYFLESVAAADTMEPTLAAPMPVKNPFKDAPVAASDDQTSVPAPAFDKVEVVTVKHRPVAFVAEAINAVFGMSFARPAGGTLLAIAAPADRIKTVLEVLEQLDVSPAVVEVSASFVEVTRSGASARGLSLVADTIGNQLGGVSILPGQGRVAIRAGRYEMVLDALASDGRFRQVSNSRLVGDDAQQLSLSVGDETPTISSTSRDQSGNAIQNVVYRPSGVILDVLPRVLGSGRLSLTVDGQVSSFQSTTNGVSASPTLVKRQIKTSVSIEDGQVLVIGGLDDSKSSGANAGFSFLPDSWGNKSATDSKTDLVLVLSARVLPASPESLAK